MTKKIAAPPGSVAHFLSIKPPKTTKKKSGRKVIPDTDGVAIVQLLNEATTIAASTMLTDFSLYYRDQEGWQIKFQNAEVGPFKKTPISALRSGLKQVHQAMRRR